MEEKKSFEPKIRPMLLELEPLSWLRIRTCAARFRFRGDNKDGNIQHEAGLLENMLKKGSRVCVPGKEFLYFFNGAKLTHVIQKMVLFEVAEYEFDLKLYKYRKWVGEAGKDQLVQAKVSQEKGKKRYHIDKDALENDQVYYLARKLGKHEHRTKQRQFYCFDGQLYEIYDQKVRWYYIGGRYWILDNEEEELKRLQGIPDLRQRLENGLKISNSMKENFALQKLKQILSELPLNKSPQKIIARLSKGKFREIAAVRQKLDDCWIDGVLNNVSALELLHKIGVIIEDDIDWAEFDARRSQKMWEGEAFDEGFSIKRMSRKWERWSDRKEQEDVVPVREKRVDDE